jgi:hypothetical protein
MATVTPNFNWPVPTSTDLVKDGATAIEALGDSIDASMVDLKGGTTGQVLSKASNTDMDFTWVTDAAGDITGVTAGVGITGGGTSGTVTITNDMATTITAAGDIVVGTGSGTYDNLPIGTTAQVLTADTTVSPYKVKWATPASTTPSFVGVRCTVSGSQTIANATSAYIAWTTEVIDTNGFHDNVTNNTRLTVPSGKAGYYQVYATVCLQDSSAGRQIWLEINRATTQFGKIIYAQLSGYPTGFQTTTTIYLNVGDYMECGVYQTSGGNLGTEGTASIAGCMQFGMNYLGA